MSVLSISQTSSEDPPPIKFLSALNCLVVIIYTSIKLPLKKENWFDSLDIIYARGRGLCDVMGTSIPTEQMTMWGSGSDLWHLLSTGLPFLLRWYP